MACAPAALPTEWWGANHPTTGRSLTMYDSPRLIEKRRLDALKAHPLQAALAPAPLPHEIEELVAILKPDGLDNPVELLPDGTLLGGHSQVAAARLLGWQEIDCWVRNDLAAQGKGAAERRLIENNLAHQTGKLEKVRCYLR